jgi:hypothetical protein
VKHLQKFNESKEQEIINDFEEAYKTSECSFNMDYYGNNKKIKELHLYDDFYQYKDAIFRINTIPSGDWYRSKLVKLTVDPHVFKEKIFKRIQELEEAMDKIIE